MGRLTVLPSEIKSLPLRPQWAFPEGWTNIIFQAAVKVFML